MVAVVSGPTSHMITLLEKHVCLRMIEPTPSFYWNWSWFQWFPPWFPKHKYRECRSLSPVHIIIRPEWRQFIWACQQPPPEFSGTNAIIYQFMSVDVYRWRINASNISHQMQKNDQKSAMSQRVWGPTSRSWRYGKHQTCHIYTSNPNWLSGNFIRKQFSNKSDVKSK